MRIDLSLEQIPWSTLSIDELKNLRDYATRELDDRTSIKLVPTHEKIKGLSEKLKFGLTNPK